jgi:cytochrome c556
MKTMLLPATRKGLILAAGLALLATTPAFVTRAADTPAAQPETAPPPAARAEMMKSMAGMMEQMGGMMRSMAGDPAPNAAPTAKPMCACCDMMAGKMDTAKATANVSESDKGQQPADPADPHAGHARP